MPSSDTTPYLPGGITRLLAEQTPLQSQPVPDVKAIRRKLGLTQSQFAFRFGLALAAIKDWEQHRRRPEQAACTLLRVIDAHPEIVVDALRSVITRHPSLVKDTSHEKTQQ